MSEAAHIEGHDGLARAFAVVWRYGLSTFGITSISGAHFLVSLLFLQAFPPRIFGLISFVFVLVPLFLSSSGALLGATIARVVARSGGLDSAELDAISKTNAVFSAGTSVAVLALMLASGAELVPSLLMAAYGGAMALRWFARSYTYALRERVPVTISDVVYSGLLSAGIVTLWASGSLSMSNAAIVMLGSTVLALLPFGRAFLVRQERAIRRGALRKFGPIWRELSQWSLLGAVSTEITANAHAYLVNLISGPNAFALLAAGTLFMRPASLLLSALPDLERPIMAQAIAEGDFVRAWRCATEMRIATCAMWLLTSVAAIGVLLWWPKLLLRHNYDVHGVIVVVLLWSAITFVRTIRGPESVLLQAAAEFRPLAAASVRSSVVSVAATLLLLVIAGPIASLGGILAGDTVLTAIIFVDIRRWNTPVSPVRAAP